MIVSPLDPLFHPFLAIATRLLYSLVIFAGFDLTNDLRALFAGASTANIRSVADDLCNVVCLKRLVENVSFHSLFPEF